MSAIARGATFAVTEMTPAAPTPMASRAVRSSPLSTLKSGRTGRDELAHARRLAHGFLDADDARQPRQPRHRGRQEVDRRAARDVVEQHRNARVRGDRFEMQEQTLLRRAAHKTGDATSNASTSSSEIQRARSTEVAVLLVPALAMSEARLPSDAARVHQQIAQLAVGDGGGFAGGTGDDDSRRAIGNMEFEET